MATVARIFSLHDPPWQICFVVLVPLSPVPWRPLIGMFWVFGCFVFLCSPWHGTPLAKAFWVVLAPYAPTWLGRPLSMMVEGRSE